MRFLTSLFLFAAVAFAEQPPNHVIERQCLQVDHIEICALNRLVGSVPRLQINYKNTHLKGSQITAWISLNGRSDLYPLSIPLTGFSNEPTYAATIGDVRNVMMCYHGAENEAVDFIPASLSGYLRCPYANDEYPIMPAGKGYVGWWADTPKKEELDLFFFAYDHGDANAWDVQVAFKDDKGNWDSRYGKNYQFRFD